MIGCRFSVCASPAFVYCSETEKLHPSDVATQKVTLLVTSTTAGAVSVNNARKHLSRAKGRNPDFFDGRFQSHSTVPEDVLGTTGLKNWGVDQVRRGMDASALTSLGPGAS